MPASCVSVCVFNRTVPSPATKLRLTVARRAGPRISERRRSTLSSSSTSTSFSSSFLPRATAFSEGSFACPLKMNTIPHPRETRHFFYKDVTDNLLSTLEEGEVSRMSIQIMIPELNPQNDVYRVGTMLELVRTMASALVQDGKRVRVCVQASMGKGVFQGLPLQLSGVRKLLDLMDWHEDVIEFISFGAIGKEEVREEDDIYIIIAPQNIIGASVQPSLEAMCQAAGERPVVLLNPNLVDIPSAGNVMQVRGREERMEFIKQFKEIYHFRLLYKKPYFHPIYGCIRYTYPNAWEIYKRVVQKTGLTGRAGKEEKYCFAKSYSNQPKPSLVTQAIAMDLSF